MKNVLPLPHQQRYETLKQLVGELHQTLTLPDSSGLVLKAQSTALQQFFREQVLSLQSDILSPAIQHWVQSYHVEIDKQVRLLSVDILFLQAARQSTTTEERRQQVCDRLGILKRYCDALLGAGDEGEGVKG